MVVPTVVALICIVVLLVSWGTHIRDAVAARRAPALVPSSGSDAPDPTAEDPGRWPLLAWVGVAAFAVLVGAVVLDRRPPVDDLAFAVLLLGFAGDRALHLVRRRRPGAGSAAAAEAIALVVGALGLLFGATL